MTTVGDNDSAEMIAGELLAKKLAACVQIAPCRSMYRWQGKIEKDDEYLLIIKSKGILYPELEKVIRRIHPYEVPELLAMDIAAGNPDYLHWLEQEVLSPIPLGKKA